MKLYNDVLNKDKTLPKYAPVNFDDWSKKQKSANQGSVITGGNPLGGFSQVMDEYINRTEDYAKEAKKNTALNTGGSVVDFLKSQGKDSSFANREKLASAYGISNYSGTYDQNVQLLDYLKNGDAPVINKPVGETTPVVNASASADTPSENATQDTPSEPVKNTYTTPEFQVSDAYNKAMEYTNSLLQQLNSGRTAYTDQINSLLNEYKNRDAFSYDASTDPMFQQMLASSMNSGKMAMEDTIGQAAALTGGYGNTYGTRAGNAAYNQYISEAYGNLPEYYNLALQAYNMEGDQMLNELAMLQDADNREYNRLMDAYTANLGVANDMYNREYSQYLDQVTQQNYENEMAYKKYLAEQDQANIDREYDYTVSQDILDREERADERAYQREQDAIKQQNYENEIAYQKERDELTQENLEKDFNWRVQQDALDRLAYNRKLTAGVSGDNATSEDDEEVTYKAPTPKMYSEALEAYAKGGDYGLKQYCDTILEYDIETLDDHVHKYGEITAPGAKAYTKVKETANGLWGIDNNDVVEDQYGNRYKLSELPSDVAKVLTGLKKGETYDFSEKKKIN